MQRIMLDVRRLQRKACALSGLIIEPLIMCGRLMDARKLANMLNGCLLRY